MKLTTIVLSAGMIMPVSNTAIAGDGVETYKLVCSGCHEAGIDGAPRLDEKAAWRHRINQGTDTLYNTTIDGKCKFFVQELRKDLSDEEIKAAVDYMVSQVK